jgi:hypothetical protein
MATLVKLICKNCGKEFTVKKGTEKQTCSTECRWELRKKNDEKYYVEKECKNCGKVFKSKKKENKKYCSYNCSGEAKHRIATEKRICVECGNEFEERIKYKRKLCSEECRKKWDNRPEVIKMKTDKSKKTLLNKYGVETFFATDEFKENYSKYFLHVDYDTITKKVKNTKKEIYGDENYNNHKQISSTKRKRYNNGNYNNRLKFHETINQKFIEKYSENGYKILDFLPNNQLKIKHPDGHVFEIPRTLFIIRAYENREISTKYQPQNSNISNGELELNEFLKELNLKIIRNSKNIIKPNELDLYIPKDLAHQI